MPFLIDVCLPVFSAVTLYCVVYILYVLPLYYVVFNSLLKYYNEIKIFFHQIESKVMVETAKII